MNDMLLFYLILGIVALGFILMTLPTIIARRIVDRQKREGLYKTKKQA